MEQLHWLGGWVVFGIYVLAFPIELRVGPKRAHDAELKITFNNNSIKVN